MELVYKFSRGFQNDLEEFKKSEVRRILTKIDYLTSSKELFIRNTTQPIRFKLIHDLESSLYSLRIAPNIRIILTYDEDPIFNQLIVTLIGIARRDNIKRVYKTVGDSLYQDLLNRKGESYGHN